MHPIIESKKDKLAVLCRKRHVKRLALFGSAVGNRFDDQSNDIDFLVDFLPIPPSTYADEYFGLLRELEALFDRPIDLVESKPIRNPYFKEAVEETQVSLYEDA